MLNLKDVLQDLRDNYDAQWCGKYGEPGYNQPAKGVILCNWNHHPHKVMDFLSAEGYALEWGDEWVIDGNSDKAWRISPDSYHWECQLILGNDGEYIFPDDGAEAFIEALSITDAAQSIGCLPSWVSDDDLKILGYELAEKDLETGWHPGQTADPVKLAKRAFERGAESVVFRKQGNSQFYTVFQLWVSFP